MIRRPYACLTAALLALSLLLPVEPARAQVVLPDFADLVERQGGAVVNISTTQVVRSGGRGLPQLPNIPEDDPFFEFFRRFLPPNQGAPGPRDLESRSLGSGFIISADGFILTNAHVVEGAEDITVRLTDKREFRAKVVGADRRTDIALLKIDATGLPRVALGDASRLRVGEWVVAIGSPFGFDNSVTAGIVSAKGRALPQENFVPFIQTDVAINPGNSGGPLFNLRGEVIGINSQIYSRTGGFMGLSFAIPIDVAMEVVTQLRNTGRVARGRIGVVIQEVTRELAESFGLKKPMGALVNSLEKGGPAQSGGIEPSDIILRFDGKVVNTSGDLPRIVAATRPGSKVPVEVWRKGQSRELFVTVADTPDERAAARGPQRGQPGPQGQAPQAQPPNVSGRVQARQGLAVIDLTPEQRAQLRLAAGVLVDEAQGNAARAGIRRGDVVVAINNVEIKTAEQFNALMGQFERGRNVALLVRRGENSIYIPLRIEPGS
ncbi:MAG: DegQ family serine endoprotease [Rhodocyclaceae bacterium]|jgi:serine protease Do|nr:DegQ family serine endoprotease [Rhodocyclaceae bacterium]MCE2978510.1 DegQ family serine endoprotease [Betaproteobacteria bacterium]MCA3073683.1 DegQ family serine endoprotease [Rhodocyclaceae bacterium]MCA3088960.1 DegQ family serine endoprotease [Rhodocyclaceae bacterium]MCA3095696.1 DegQ family serine endoprotease [Rhodocyclaceae bacterium]